MNLVVTSLVCFKAVATECLDSLAILVSRFLVLTFVFSLTEVLPAVAPNPPAERDMPSETVSLTLTVVASVMLLRRSYLAVVESVVVFVKLTVTLYSLWTGPDCLMRHPMVISLMVFS